MKQSVVLRLRQDSRSVGGEITAFDVMLGDKSIGRLFDRYATTERYGIARSDVLDQSEVLVETLRGALTLLLERHAKAESPLHDIIRYCLERWEFC